LGHAASQTHDPLHPAIDNVTIMLDIPTFN
jgi:hypothetical protein